MKSEDDEINAGYSDYLVAYALTPSKQLTLQSIKQARRLSAFALGVQDAMSGEYLRSFKEFKDKLKRLEDG